MIRSNGTPASAQAMIVGSSAAEATLRIVTPASASCLAAAGRSRSARSGAT